METPLFESSSPAAPQQPGCLGKHLAKVFAIQFSEDFRQGKGRLVFSFQFSERRGRLTVGDSAGIIQPL